MHEGELTQDVARAAKAEHHLAAAGVDVARLHMPFEQEQDLVPPLATVHQALTAAEPAGTADRQQ